MNKIILIGNLTRDPELRTTQSGLSVCSFTIAVNGRAKPGEEPPATFFRVTAWRQLADNCGKYLAKGRKVCVCGTVGVSTYQANDGSTRASLEVTADEVEFLSPREQGSNTPQANPAQTPPSGGMTLVQTDDLPF